MTLTPRIAFLMTLPPLLWASNAVIGRLYAGVVPPLTLNALRWTIACVLLLPLGWRALRAPRDLLARGPHLLLLGLLGVGCYNALQYLALETSTPINVTLIAASMPVWMLTIGALVYRVRPAGREVLGAVLSVAGVLLVIARGDATTLARVHFVPGDLFILVATLCWAFYSWLLARPPALMRAPLAPQVEDAQGRRGWDWSEALLVQIVFGLVVTTLCAGAELGVGGRSLPAEWNAWMLLGLVYLAIGPSIIAYRSWGIGVAAGGPALAAFFGNLTPVFAALLSAAVLGETPRWYHAAAFALIVAGIVVSSGRRAAKSATDAAVPSRAAATRAGSSRH